ncbi:MAG: cobalamin biosynthesis protein CobD [Alphaproteobacteria bacterium]|nr:MAG: cobalamin biosynthesis protein CobD [Alphaproteobacteria bacterium]
MLLTWPADSGGPWIILLAALLLDTAIGDPRWLYRAVPHPVAAFGGLIARLEAHLNRPHLSPAVQRRRGIWLTVAAVAGAGLGGFALERATLALSGGWAIEAALAAVLLAGRGLYDHVAAVAAGLARSLDHGRAAVAHIVGRDPESLDTPGVARAGAESLAENFSDGVVAPVFWFALFGLGGLAAYKALNTLDSMIGHRSERFAAFGAFAARLDDACNWIPARLSGLLLAGAATLLPGACAAGAWRAMRRDAPHHRSPNAGWPEAALAGALGLALAGPRRYGGRLFDDRWMGDGRAELTVADLRRALRLYLVANAILFAGVGVSAVLSSYLA